jgi:bacteriorhodopsin
MVPVSWLIMATYPPVPPPPAPLPQAKKSNVLKWVLIGIGACFMLVVVAVVGLGLFVAQKGVPPWLRPR